VICAECKREIAESSQSCPVCGAPVTNLARAQARTRAMTNVMRSRAQAPLHPSEPPMGPLPDALRSSSSAALPGDAVAQRRDGGSSRRLAMAITGVALVAGAALVALGAVIVVITAPHTTSSPHLAQRTRPVPEKSWWLSWFGLRPGDCLNSSNLGLGTDNGFPEAVIAVPCTRQHLAEVYFAGNVWPESQANYPGDSAVSNLADTQCQKAFAAYDGIDISQSELQYHYWYPAGGDDWGQGDRQVVCVAYQPYSPMSISVKGSRL
jgi:hypothetical protein